MMRLLMIKLGLTLLCFNAIKAQDYKVILVLPPPSSCVDNWISDDLCNPINKALGSSTSYLHIKIAPGVYYNKNWSPTSPPKSYNNGPIVKIQSKHHIILEAQDPSHPPTLKFDGSGAITGKDVEYLEIRGLIIEGPNERITGHEASINRQRRTGRKLPMGYTTGNCSTNECGSCNKVSQCKSTPNCKWRTSGKKCGASSLGYYGGNGISIWPWSSSISKHILIENNIVSKCPGSGIRANKADYITAKNNIVFDNTWWTVSASSGLVFAEIVGTGINTITGNVVYGNRNFMPFFYEDLSSLSGSHEAADGYSSFNQSYIIDGSGVYITRNQNYQGVMNLTGNIAFDNGINGLVVHKTSNPKVKVFVEKNIVFGNGRTTRDVEGRQKAGGVVVNHGPPAGRLSLIENIVYTDTIEDVTYQCFGGCSISKNESHDNVKCIGAVSSSYPDEIFRSVNCNSYLNFTAIRSRYSKSTQPTRVPQYSFFAKPLNTPSSTTSSSISPQLSKTTSTSQSATTSVRGNYYDIKAL